MLLVVKDWDDESRQLNWGKEKERLVVTNQESEGPIQSQELYMCVCVGGGRDTTMAVFRAGNLQSLLHILCGHLTTDYKELRTQRKCTLAQVSSSTFSPPAFIWSNGQRNYSPLHRSIHHWSLCPMAHQVAVPWLSLPGPVQCLAVVGDSASCEQAPAGGNKVCSFVSLSQGYKTLTCAHWIILVSTK